MPSNFDYCAALVREADRDRYLATLFAPADKRDALFALYALNAEIARVRDVAREPMPGEIRLQWWREVLEGERAGEAAAHPVAAALLATLERHGFVATPLIELIDAHGFDLCDEPMANLGALELYCIRTQSPVFAMAAGILGGRTPPPQLATMDAAIAAAFGGVLSGLGRHAARRQLFLPLDVLERHGVAPESVFAGQGGAPLAAALAELRALARRHLAAAQTALQAAPAPLWPAFLPLATLGPTLRAMERRDADPYRVKPLSPLRRQWLIWRAARDPQRIFTG